jgi:hypothetical protein
VFVDLVGAPVQPKTPALPVSPLRPRRRGAGESVEVFVAASMETLRNSSLGAITAASTSMPLGEFGCRSASMAALWRHWSAAASTGVRPGAVFVDTSSSTLMPPACR